MKGMESGKDKVKKICDILRKETLEPAQLEADEIVERAHKQAEDLIAQARNAIEKMNIEAHQEIERQKNIFQSSLAQACKQALESLKEDIEEKLFNQELSRLLTSLTQDPKVIEQLVSAVIKALDKEGIDANLSVLIPASVPARSVNALLAKEIIERLKEKSVLVGSITGGIEVKLHKENITIDITDAALKEIVSGYIRKDFREILFGKNSSK
ncbi:MAG: V-type ATP synthase subunit E [Rhabdochlamydiaceae bacterium]|nr:V-type ATP synthase subunit E [Rhabdochlamydiaceae bacterium]